MGANLALREAGVEAGGAGAGLGVEEGAGAEAPASSAVAQVNASSCNSGALFAQNRSGLRG